MGLLQELGGGQGYLKAGFLGFQKSGKTFTSALLALAVRQMFKLDGPIAFFDTETGSEYIEPIVRHFTGKKMVGIRSRSFDQLVAVGKECEAEGVSVLIADSMTHVWRELCGAYLKNINDARKKKNRAPITKLEFQHWGPIKDRWAAWSDLYTNSKLHVIVCGRAGYEYDFEKDDEGHKELIKTGIKMKTEGEFGFEPSLLVEMERLQDLEDDRVKVGRRANVIGDRFSVLDGANIVFPSVDAANPKQLAAAVERVAKFFEPHLKRLTPGALATVDTETRSDLGVDEAGDDEWRREKRTRTILCEEIQGELLRLYPGQTAAEKKGKADLLEKALGTRSWTAVEETMDSPRLRQGLDLIRAEVAAKMPQDALPMRQPGEDDLTDAKAS